MNPVKSYLSLPDACKESMGLRWSRNDNALESHHGTFAFGEEIAEFLEGFSCIRRIVHFAYIVRFLHLLRDAPADVNADHPGRRWLRMLFKNAKGSLRSAGAFCGHVCREVPAAREANHVADICRRLRSREAISAFLGEQAPEGEQFLHVVTVGYSPPELPPIDLATFDARILNAFQSCRVEEVTYWFTHGRAPIEETAGQSLARAIPPTLEGHFATLLTRPRLARARAWIAHLYGAIALPPRRLAEEEMPLGGYADVTTRGHVDQILPSQFALDEWDFFRRYAERELLYFRREEPREPACKELVVILDQGVRTWGDIRLVLSSAVIALGKLAAQREQCFLLATNSVAALDPLQLDAESLGQIVESSDLAAHPGLALERVLEQPSKGDRDIVLLTHPRNLDEPDVRAATRRQQAGDRIFALTVERHGQAELCEFRRGVPVAIRSFRVDFSQSPAVPPAPLPHPSGIWHGDVEPIGFPFLFGVAGKIGMESFDFDLDGTQLLTVASHGICHLWDVNGQLKEILPRATYQGSILRWKYSWVHGVANGFVVIGRAGKRWFAVHLDIALRKVSSYYLGADYPSAGQVVYSPEHHNIIQVRGRSGIAIDLGTGERFATDLGGAMNRAHQAWIAWERRQIAIRNIQVGQPSESNSQTGAIWSIPLSGMVILRMPWRRKEGASEALGPGWSSSIIPFADGQPLFRNRAIRNAQLSGDVLAVLSAGAGSLGDLRLDLIRATDGAPLGMAYQDSSHCGYRLSANGEWLAQLVTESKVVISQVSGGLGKTRQTWSGGFVHQMSFALGVDRLVMGPGRYQFLLEWSTGVLKVTYHRDAEPELEGKVIATPSEVPEPCRYDPQRWILGASGTLLAASDRYGQVAVFDRSHNLVCMFFAFRTRLAGWMPDGTQFTQATTADAATLERFGRALLAASQMESTA